MGWNVNEATLKSYETKLNNITTSTKSESIQRSEIEQLYQEWQTLTDPLPKHARLERKFVDTFIAEPADVQPYTMNGNDVYFSQQNYNIVMTVTVYDVDLYSDISKKISVITTTITPKQNTGQVDIVQEVPKEIPHASIKNKTPGITSKGNTYTSTFSNLNNPVTLTYAVEGVSITAEELFNYKTIILTSQPQTEQNTSGTEIKDYECGDSVCQTPFEDGITCPEDCAPAKKPIPWMIIVIVLLVLIVGIFYFNAYRGKGDFRSITRGKSPFINTIDLEKVKDYIKKSVDQGKLKKEITKLLFLQGWTKAQIIYAFNEAEWELRKVLIDKAPKKSLNLEPVTLYVKKCLTVNMDVLQIKNNLLGKGWTPQQIEEALKKAKQEMS